MKRSSLLWSLPALGILASLGLAAFPGEPARGTRDRSRQEVVQLIQQLGDKRPAVREAATRRLLQMEDAAPALRAAVKSPDLEIARRAALILEEWDRRPAERAFARLKAYARNRQVDQAVELFVWRSKWEDEKACWQVLTGLAADLIERGRKEFGAVVPPPEEWLAAGDFDRYLKATRAPFLAGSRVMPAKVRRGQGVGFVLRGKDVVVEGSEKAALVACVGSLRMGASNVSVIYATGPVELDGVSTSLLVCDGDLKLRTIGNSLVLVRGDVYCGDSISNSLVIMTGRLHLRKYTLEGRLGDKVLWRKPASAEVRKDAKVCERQADLLGLVKFFETAQAGIEIEAAKGGVHVKAVDATKPFTKAGLRAGDVITAVDGQASPDPEVFRRQLRSALAREGFMIQVTRGDERRQIRIPAPRP